SGAEGAARGRRRRPQRRAAAGAGRRAGIAGRAAGGRRRRRARRRVSGRARDWSLARHGRAAARLAPAARLRAPAGRRRARRAARPLAATRRDGAQHGERSVSRRPLALELAEEITAWRQATLPGEVIARACDLLLDFLGVTLGGAAEESSVVLRHGLDR